MSKTIMRTILHLSTVHPRSDTRILLKEAQSLAFHLPHKVLLMVADGKGNVDAGHGRVSIYDLGSLNGGRFRRVLIGPWRALLAIRRLKPAVVHFHDPELIPLGIFLKIAGYKVIYDIHEDVPRQILSKAYLPWIIRRHVAWIVSATEWLGATVFDAMVPATPKIADRFPITKTVTVHNYPIATELLQSSPIPYVERPKCFVYAGVIATIRGVVEIVSAVGNVPGAKLDLAGTCSPHGFANELGTLPGWASVDYHGELPRKKIADLLGRARAGLVLHHPIPNEIDALPIKMFEYMSVGLPIIASDFPLLRRIIESAGCGLVVDPLSPKAIEDAMRWILEHPTEAKSMGRRGRQAVDKIYNWDAESEKLIGLYKNLLAP